MKLISQKKKLLKKIKKREITVGSWLQINNCDIAEIMGKSNYDWIVVDMEHSSTGINELSNLFRAIELGKTLPFVRIPQNSDHLCSRVLDAGACGIIFPNVKNANQINFSIKKCLWPKFGSRGLGFSRSNLYGIHISKYIKQYERPIIIAMIESLEGVENLDSILKNKFIDSIFIGPYDLSMSMGIPGQFETKKFKSEIKKILNTCKKYQVSMGMHVTRPDKKLLKKYIKNGFNFIAYGADIIFLTNNSANPL